MHGIGPRALRLHITFPLPGQRDAGVNPQGMGTAGTHGIQSPRLAGTNLAPEEPVLPTSVKVTGQRHGGGSGLRRMLPPFPTLPGSLPAGLWPGAPCGEPSCDMHTQAGAGSGPLSRSRGLKQHASRLWAAMTIMRQILSSCKQPESLEPRIARAPVTRSAPHKGCPVPRWAWAALGDKPRRLLRKSATGTLPWGGGSGGAAGPAGSAASRRSRGAEHPAAPGAALGGPELGHGTPSMLVPPRDLTLPVGLPPPPPDEGQPPPPSPSPPLPTWRRAASIGGLAPHGALPAGSQRRIAGAGRARLAGPPRCAGSASPATGSGERPGRPAPPRTAPLRPAPPRGAGSAAAAAGLGH